VKNLRKTGKIGGLIHKKAISKEELKRLFDSSELKPQMSTINTLLDELELRTLSTAVRFFLCI